MIIIYTAAGLFQKKMACQNRNMLFLLHQWSAQNNNDPTLKHVMPVVFTSQHHQLHASMTPGLVTA
jgi:hypothetical protein